MSDRDEEDVMRLRDVDWYSVNLNSTDLLRLLSRAEKSSLVFIECDLLL